jgi:truncated hemoglobin YjbI
MTINLYDAIGGLPALEFAVERFSERVAMDPDLAALVAGWDVQKLKNYAVGLLGKAVGGPARRGGRAQFQPGQFDRIAEHLAGSLRELSLPEALVAAVMDRVRGPANPVGKSRVRRKRLKVWAAGSSARRVVAYVN